MVRNYVKKRLPPAYSQENLKNAMEAVNSKQMTLYRASKHYGIPKPTLFKRVKGQRGVKSTSMGRPTAIPPDVEASMAAHIKTMEKWGFGLSKKEILLAIGQYVKDKNLKTPFKDGVPGDDYFANFKRRHGLSQKKPQGVEIARKRCVNPFIMADYFNLLKDVTTNIPPERIFNIDETSFCLDPSRVKVVGEKGKAAHRVTSGPGKENFSVLMGGSAAGGKLPPMIIFKGKNVWDSWLASSDSEYPDISYAATPNGWMGMETFTNYFQRTFINNIPQERPVVVIYDGHSSHTSLSIIEKALQEKVIILKLPPHTSHLLQPMDLAVFKPLKQKYDEALIKWQRKHYGTKLPKSVFSSLISQVWKELDPGAIKSGFRKAGIFPFCASVIPMDKFEPAALQRFQCHLNSKNASSSSDDSQIDILASSQHITSGGTEEGIPIQQEMRTPVQNEAAVSSVENSFEEILLGHLKQVPLPHPQKRRKICPGAEVITSTEFVKKMKEKDQAGETVPKKRKPKKTMLSDSSDEEQCTVPETQSHSDEDIDCARSPTPPIEEELYREANPEDFVLTKFPVAGGTSHVHYVAKVLQCFDNGVEVSCLRKCAKALGKYYFPQVEDKSIILKGQIVFVLPNSSSSQHCTKRQQSLISFPISLDQYNVR